METLQQPQPRSGVVAASVNIQSISIDRIIPSPYQTRRVFDEVRLRELAETLKAHGLMNAICVRPIAGGQFELIAGERRLRAARLLGWAAIDAKVEVVADREAAERVVVENLQREDLNALEQAVGFKKLQDMGLTLEEIAPKVGIKDRSTISRYLALLELPQIVQDLLPRGNISEKHCRSLRRITDQTMQIKLALQADQEGWSVKETDLQINSFLKTYERGSTPKSEPAAKLHDPLGMTWMELKSLAQESQNPWGVSYEDHRIPGKNGEILPAWHFWIANNGPEARKDLRGWLLKLIQALDDEPQA